MSMSSIRYNKEVFNSLNKSNLCFTTHSCNSSTNKTFYESGMLIYFIIIYYR
jgi:hypothetical protein